MADWLESIAASSWSCSPATCSCSATRFIERFRNRVVNVHPALLPAFPGLDAIGQALAHGVKVTGVTVHFVDEGVDTGPIILQRAVRFRQTATGHELEEAIHADRARAAAREAIRHDRRGRG